VKCHSSMQNWLFGLPVWILCEQSPWDHIPDYDILHSHHRENLKSYNPLFVKDYEHTLNFAFHLSRIFRSRWVRTFRVLLMFSSLNPCLIIAMVSVVLFLRFAQNLMLFLYWIHCKIASGQIHDSK
jgi:hypothetical protein